MLAPASSAAAACSSLTSSTAKCNDNATSLCRQVPALLGLNGANFNKAAVSKHQQHARHHHHQLGVDDGSGGGGGGGGFYKRLIDWLGRKKKSRRRFSDIHLPGSVHGGVHGSPNEEDASRQQKLAVNVSTTRNRSAPMIFDVRRPLVEEGRAQQQQQQQQPRHMTQSSAPSDCQIVDNNAAQDELKAAAAAADTAAAASSAAAADNGDDTTQQFNKQDSDDKEMDAEWIIPWDDVEIGQTITHGRCCTINRYVLIVFFFSRFIQYPIIIYEIKKKIINCRGRWHGDVIVHQFHLEKCAQVADFWTDVESLSKLRHENILLFMGIATRAPAYAIVNSAPRGVSVSDYRVAIKNGKQERIG